ncbi:MAG: endo-1,4-beta-xylanase [Spirochaetales bacterium]|nr:endo-1,4-beta-xylanase [Spirochaetales bacterium]
MKRPCLVLSILCCAVSLAFAQTQESPDAGTEKDIPGLAALYRKYFDIGTCIETTQLAGAPAELAVKHFSSITPENCMKPERIEPAEGTFTFDAADATVDFAVARGLKVRGHTLVWHQQNPKWLFKDENGGKVSKKALIARLETYIKTVVSRYRGKIYAWDVVNEPTDSNGLRRSEWLDIIGPEYIELAFRFAHEADPKAKLFLNEIDTIDGKKGDTIRTLVRSLRAKKAPIDGLGLQFHITLFYPGIPAVSDALRKYNALGVDLHITELDMSLNADTKVKRGNAPPDLLVRQAHRYRELFELFKRTKRITNVTFWGFQDSRSWLTYSPTIKADWPLLFDAYLKPKLAFWGLVDPARLPADVEIKQAGNTFAGFAVKGTPLVDGVEDAVWTKAPAMDIVIFVQGKGATGAGRALWDGKNLYVFVKVKDPLLSKKSANDYEQDSVEIFVDEKNNKSFDYKEDDAQYRVNFTNDFSSRGNPAKIVSAVAVTSDGYAVEAAIPFRFALPKPGTKIGFDLQINDDQGKGRRESYSKWNDPTNESYRNTSGFGTLVLK